MAPTLRSAVALSLYVAGRPILVVGSGTSAGERSSRMRAAGADVREVAAAAYTADMCADVFIVVAETGDQDLDRRIAGEARSAGALAYAHDQPAVSDFAFPAIARRGSLSIAVATDGVAPALARRVREELDRVLAEVGPDLDLLLAALERERAAAPPGAERAARLYDLACRLRIAGRLSVDPID